MHYRKLCPRDALQKVWSQRCNTESCVPEMHYRKLCPRDALQKVWPQRCITESWVPEMHYRKFGPRDALQKVWPQRCITESLAPEMHYRKLCPRDALQKVGHQRCNTESWVLEMHYRKLGPRDALQKVGHHRCITESCAPSDALQKFGPQRCITESCAPSDALQKVGPQRCITESWAPEMHCRKLCPRDALQKCIQAHIISSHVWVKYFVLIFKGTYIMIFRMILLKLQQYFPVPNDLIMWSSQDLHGKLTNFWWEGSQVMSLHIVFVMWGFDDVFVVARNKQENKQSQGRNYSITTPTMKWHRALIFYIDIYIVTDCLSRCTGNFL